MLYNYLLIALRNIRKDKFHATINVIGLMMGIASGLFIIIYIHDELSYDRFHAKADRTYRLIEFVETDGAGERSSSVPFPSGPTLAEDYSRLIETQVRFFDFQSPTLLITEQESKKQFNEPNVYFVDSTFFHVFDYDFISGDKATALDEPNSIVLTQTSASRYFGDEDAVGKILEIEGRQDLVVTGIIKNPPTNSHVTFDMLVSFSTLKPFFGGHMPDDWFWNPCWTYIVFKDGVDLEELRRALPEFVKKYFPEAIKDQVRLSLQPLTDIHLKSDLQYEIQHNGNLRNIYVFSVIGLVILVIASMNFMNLSTARAINRAKEVGLRKTLGSRRGQLIGQFLTESIVMSLLAMIIAIFVVLLGLPYFNSLADKAVRFDIFLNLKFIGATFAVFLFIGVGSGFYPAFVLSSFAPTKVLKGFSGKVGRGATLRKSLVVVQFALSIIMIISTIVANDQLEYLRKSDTGFVDDQVVYISALRTSMTKNYTVFKKELEERSDVVSVTAVHDVLGSRHNGDNFQFEGMDKPQIFPVMWIGHDFFKTFDLKIVAGREFMENIKTDDSLALIVNESLVRQFDWTPEQAIDKPFSYQHHRGQIVGVVEDFNFVSKHKAIEPLALQLLSDPLNFSFSLKYVAIKLKSDDLPRTMAMIEDKCKQFGVPFNYFFLDEALDALYRNEERLGQIASMFSVLAIVVACLGLFALASFMADGRRKEIGIRKVVGSSVSQVVTLLIKDFLVLVAIAFVIACPVAWLGVQSWLNNFAFHIDIGWTAFIIAGLSTMLLALLTISYKAFQAARMNPVNTLRSE